MIEQLYIRRRKKKQFVDVSFFFIICAKQLYYISNTQLKNWRSFIYVHTHRRELLFFSFIRQNPLKNYSAFMQVLCSFEQFS